MADILKNPTATFEAEPVWSDVKINNTARVDSDSSLWVTANWANAVDDQLKLINSFFLGEDSAGAAGTSVEFLGGLIAAENLAVGGNAGIGDYAIASADIEVKTTAAGTGRVMFGKSGAPANGGMSYAHATDLLSLLASGSPRVEIDSASLRPASHNVTKLGDSSHRWSETHASEIFARTGATVGGLASAVSLTVDGGGSLAIPEIVLAHGGAAQATIDAPDTGELRVATAGPMRLTGVGGGLGLPVLTTAQRTALAGFAGLAVYDSEEMDVLIHNGGDWSAVGILNYGLDQTLAIDNATGGTDISITNGDAIAGEDGGSISFETTTGTLSLSSRAVIGDAGSEIEGVDFAGGTLTANLTVSEIGGANPSQILIHRHSTNNSPSLAFLRTNSDTSAHAAVTDGQELLNICAGGWDGIDYALGGCLGFDVSGTPGAGDMPTKFFVSVCADGSESPTERFSIDPDGTHTITGDLVVNGDVALPTIKQFAAYDFHLDGAPPTLSSRGGTGYGMPVLNFPDPSVQVNYAYFFVETPRLFDSAWTVDVTIWFAQETAGAGNITWAISFDRIESGVLTTDNSFDTDGPVIDTTVASGTDNEIQSATFTIPYSYMDGALGGEVLFCKIQNLTTGDTFTGDRDLISVQMEFSP
jgi:hypothetical protein